ncbi:MAG: flagellin lysine-N-methylase [Eubacteriales bacterium]|nr:flagellin lysine-N-methylase [Eubacteriales bacterium]
MKLRVPSYYRQFRCLAGQCKHSCCIGWEIDIDEETCAYYQEIGGDFGERLKIHLKQDEETCFALTEDGRCPFLNRDNLCEICIELGEEALSEVCTEYPRFVTEYADVREKSMALSCEEVGRLIFESDAPLTFEEIEQETGEDLAFPEEDSEEETPFSPDDPSWYRPIEQACDYAIRLCQDRTRSIPERTAALLAFGKAIQEKINREHPEEIPSAIAEFESHPQALDPEKILGSFARRFQIYAELEVLDEEWRDTLAHVTESFAGPAGEARYTDWHARFAHYNQNREYEYEHLLVYFLFRYTMQTVYDCNFLSHITYAAASLLMIQDIDTVRFIDQGETFTLADRIDTARIYSREVEHSEENLELLQFRFTCPV